MKKTLAFDANAKQFRTDMGKPPHRFYLGADANLAQKHKEALGEFWGRVAGEGWTAENLSLAKAIAKGEEIQLRATGDDAEYLKTERRIVAKVRQTTPLRPAVIERDFLEATNQQLMDRIKALEELVTATIGAGAVQGPAITVHAALDAYNTYRLQTEIDVDTHQPTEHARTETNVIQLVRRLIPAEVPLSALTYLEIEKWCKAVAARPLSKKTGKPIKRATVKNCLKVIRPFIKWASRNYGWKRPEDWQEATLVMTRRTAEERREAIAKIEGHYTLEEIGMLWQYALPVERMLILCGLNFGGAQAEITALTLEDVTKPETVALRSKTGNIGKWIVWEETRQLAPLQFDKLPKRRQHIATKWQQLLERVVKAQPQFRQLSFKWLRKTGASFIRKLADQETASLYLSHGESSDSDDTQLAVYAAADWTRLDTALTEFRIQLLPYFRTNAIAETKTYLPLTKIEQIQKGWREGKSAIQIAQEVGAGRATVYRWRPTTDSA